MTKPDWAERIQRSRERKWNEGYLAGHNAGLLEANQALRLTILKNLMSDAVFITNVDTQIVEKIVRIVEES